VRSAQLFEASHVFTIVRSFHQNLPLDCTLVGVELTSDAIDIIDFVHPKRAIYLLGAEDTGLPGEVLAQCDMIIELPGKHSMNVCTACSLVMYDRYI
jgi:tRNA G18 (ribose-2'-O)-methylase SpoU